MRQGPEHIPVVVEDSYEEIARQVAQRIAELIRGRAGTEGRARARHRLDADRHLPRADPACTSDDGLDFSHVVTFNLDEYFPMAPDSLHSYHRFMRENLFEHVNIDPRNVHIPRGDLPRDADRDALPRLRARHRRTRAASTSRSSASARPATSASTSPARALHSRTRLVVLDTITRRGAAADFFGIENVPARGHHHGRRDDPRGAGDRPGRDSASTRPPS